MIRAVYLLVVLALLIAACEGTSDSIMADAHYCCAVAGCSAKQKASLRARMDAYDGPDAQSTREYVALALSGAGCTGSGRSKRAVGDYIYVTCPSGPYDVQYGSVSFTCQVDVRMAATVYMVSVTASTYANGTYQTSISADTYYPPANTTSVSSRTFSLTLPKYAPNGVWTVLAYAYSPSYTYYNETNTTLIVSKTKNDVAAPKLIDWGPEYINFQDDQYMFFKFGATDDFSGVASVYVNCQLAGDNPYDTYVILGYWSAPYSGQTVVSGSGSLNKQDPGPVPGGIYPCDVSVLDNMGYSAHYSTTLNFVSNGCASGTYHTYDNYDGDCITCPPGRYSHHGAGWCTSCPPGTNSSVAGASDCTPCPAGTYSAYRGSTYCSTCPAGTCSGQGQTSCTACPASRVMSNAGSKS